MRKQGKSKFFGILAKINSIDLMQFAFLRNIFWITNLYRATKLTEDLREKERNRKIQEENDQFDPVSGMLNNQMIQKRVGVFDINHFAHTKSHQVFVVKEDQENATNGKIIFINLVDNKSITYLFSP